MTRLQRHRRRYHAAAIVLAALALASCAGRDPNLVAVVQPQDRLLDCTAITTEVQANDAKMKQLAKESSNTTAGNVALGVAGAILFWPALFALDLKDAAGKEASALQQRQSYLATLAAQKNCGG